jgi:hypothetical protein
VSSTKNLNKVSNFIEKRRSIEAFRNALNYQCLEKTLFKRQHMKEKEIYGNLCLSEI